MFVFDSRVSIRTRTVTGDPCGCTGGAPRCHQAPRFAVRELGEIDMVSMALATLDLVARDDARPAFPAVYLSWWDEPPGQPGAWPARGASYSADQR
jgi:hypothetical protein